MPRQPKVKPTAYSVASDAPPSAVAAAFRGALTAVRSRLAGFWIDLISDRDWPPDVQWAVEALAPRRPPRTSILPWVKHQPSITIDLDVRRDDDFQLAMALVPYTIDGTGIADDNRIIYNGNDTGWSSYFELTEEEHQTAVQFMTAAGESAEWLVPFRPT